MAKDSLTVTDNRTGRSYEISINEGAVKPLGAVGEGTGWGTDVVRAVARERGMDANTWFGSVETIALEIVGREPVTYVANINKYFIIFSLLLEEMETRAK